MSLHSGKLTKNLVRTLGPDRHGDGSSLYLVVDPSGARRWIVRVSATRQVRQRARAIQAQQMPTEQK